MSGLFGTLHTATGGMTAQQRALQTTGHNIANANTEGYSRQRVTMSANMPISIPGVGQFGTGVQISAVQRVTDQYLVTQVQRESASLEQYTQKSDLLGQLEGIYNEPSDTGLSSQMDKFFASWTNLSSNPEMQTAKTMVVEQSKTFTDTIHHMANQMDGLHSDTLNELSKDVLDFNSTLGQLEKLNEQIFNVSTAGQAPNDLLDQRDRLIGSLTEIAGAEVKIDGFQRAVVTLDGQEVLGKNHVDSVAVVIGKNEDGTLIVSQPGKDPMTLPADDTIEVGQWMIQDSETGDYASIDIESGSTKGSQEALAVLNQKKEDFNTFVSQFAEAVNTTHSTPTIEGEEQGKAFFEIDLEDPSGTIKVNAEIQKDSSKVQAGKGLDNEVAGDGARALAISKLQSTKLPQDLSEDNYNSETMSFDNSVSGSTLLDQYNDSVTDVGIQKQQADNMAKNQDDVVALLEQRKESMSGVDINEEVTDMLRFQNAFSANAKVISVTAEMLDTLINRTGV
ncbi:flagellar hook-associated protein FlgK [Lacticigenium naphthae]|uniref:flagellar hook-associated protein FlgK n=1 Tax=Lacticigenium naphthae TaxID=515351 RepID=UPI00041BBCFC|nr:flagellar hook-associated protein FlgK [Lacticigenium naphthae]